MAKNRTFFCRTCRVQATWRSDLDSPNMYECPCCEDLFYVNYCHNCGSEVHSQVCVRCTACEWAICAVCGSCNPECGENIEDVDVYEEIFGTDEMVAFMAEIDPDSEEARIVESQGYYDDMNLALADTFELQEALVAEGLEYAENCLTDDEWLD